MFGTINAGGDTDSNGAIVGSLIGPLYGSQVLPKELYAEVTRGDYVLEEATHLLKRLVPNS
jgi:ADP-ribosylglycohydrolase